LRVAFLALAFVSLLGAENSEKAAPSYSVEGIVNSATYTPDALAPNAIACVFGTDLAYDTSAAPANIPNHMLPQVLSGVRVYVGGIAAPLLYVSPKQINFVIAADLLLGDCDLFIARQGTSGPHVKITVHDAGPGLFQIKQGMIAASHSNGGLITEDRPAHAGEVVVLYGTGLGRTNPLISSGLISLVPAQIDELKDLRVLVAGKPLEAASVGYVGLSPGSPGLYQVNLKLPQQLTADPEIRITIGNHTSPAGTKLAARKPQISRNARQSGALNYIG
jgi:uncharacterized protein (TIGR03437 family)